MNDSEPSEESTQGRASSFPRTTDSIWQEVHDAGAGDIEAVGRLCVTYRQAILAYVRRWTGTSRMPQDPEDLTQDFIARVLERNLFDGFQRRETKFRSFLLRCLGNFLSDVRRRKRIETGSLDDAENEIASNDHPVNSLDADLALDLHAQALRGMAEDYATKGMSNRFWALQRYILGADDRYAGSAGPLGMTPGNLRKFMFGLREEYHDAFRGSVSQLVTREEIASEMKHLLGLLAQLPPEIRDQGRETGASGPG